MAPQILLESFSLCNNCVMGGAVSAPGHFENNYDGVYMAYHDFLDFADRHHMMEINLVKLLSKTWVG